MAAEKKYELVVCIVNAGFSEIVMNAARSAGAQGGSIIRGRGTANPESEEFFNITVQPDKEVMIILVPADIKDDVMKAIYKNAGLATDGAGIVFSLPVNRTSFTLKPEKE
ncbi:MAG: P-II family nitrogen regulator [Bacteroidales bacterium]|nr:P-II family nitrogen regulator [Bacteroidales bacterium]